MILSRIARQVLQPDEHGMYGEITTIKDHRGPGPALSAELEEKIRLWVRDSPRIGMARNQHRHLVDIGTYLETFNINVERFKDGIPSRDSLQLFSTNKCSSSLNICMKVLN